MSRALLIDGHSVIYRSHFAFIRKPLRNSAGRNTSAAFGFANTLRRLLGERRPDFCAVVYDAPGKTFRHERYEQYKIQRPPTPEELIEQIPTIKEMVRCWGVASVEVPGVEADDVLGALALRFAAQGHDTTIATSDKDMLQLVGGPVGVYDPWKGKLFSPQDVVERLGVGPELVVDFLAMVGDSSDNVPGVPGVGPKRAVEILDRHGSLEAALENEPRLQVHAEVARLSRELIELDTDVAADVALDDLKLLDPDRDGLRRVLTELEFTSLAAELLGIDAVGVEQIEFRSADGLPTEGRVGVHWEPGQGLWVALDTSRVVEVPSTEPAAIRRLLAASGLTKVGFDLKNVTRELQVLGIELRPPIFDVGIGAWLLDPNRRGYGMENVVQQVLGQSLMTPSPEMEATYALRVLEELEPQLAASGLRDVAEQQEMPFIAVLAAMEETGVKVDVNTLEALREDLSEDLRKAESEIWRLAGVEFNAASPKQLGDVLFERLGLPKGRRTKTGYSTSSAVLEALVDENPIVPAVLRFRELSKLCGTYLEPLVRAVNPADGRIHARFHQTGTATGRLSATDPNLQNVPVRTDVGRRVREAFVAEPGRVLLSADYSQIELRVLAHLSGDSELARAFTEGQDIHAWTASAILGVDAADVTADQRRIAKMVNYGLVYGMSDFGLASRMDMPLAEARAFLEVYMKHFSGVAAWRERLIRDVGGKGHARMVSGRIRPVPDIKARNRTVAEAARRAALNAPIQGSAADIIKRAMIELHRQLPATGLGAELVLQIHDELLFEVDRADVDRARTWIGGVMEQAWVLDVPLVVHVEVGNNWAEAH